LAEFVNLPLIRYPHYFLLARIWEMQNRLTAYDAAYLALAEALGAALVTRDRAFATLTTHVRVELV
jgi:predicted nucleic acid-binding protein